MNHRAKAGVELGGGSYLIHKIYDDQETLSLVAAACEVLGKISITTTIRTLLNHSQLSLINLVLLFIDRARAQSGFGGFWSSFP